MGQTFIDGVGYKSLGGSTNITISCALILGRSHYLERASALDFKDTVALRFGDSDVFLSILVTNITSYPPSPPPPKKKTIISINA